jgi:hypothetical protein
MASRPKGIKPGVSHMVVELAPQQKQQLRRELGVDLKRVEIHLELHDRPMIGFQLLCD